MEGQGLTAGLLESAQSGIMTELAAALPAAGVVFAAIAGLSIGIKIFKKVTGARA